MQRHKLMLLSTVGLFAIACGGTHYAAQRAASAAPGEPAGAPIGGQDRAAPQGEAAPPGAAASAPAAAAPRSEEGPASGGALDEQRARRNERPGLATTWGETRESHVSTAPFFRADPEHPFATLGLFYNDRAGVRAMARRSGFSDFGDNMARAGGNAITVRLLDANGNPLPGVQAGEQSFVIGRNGQRYVIEIKNHTGNRIEAVATVDGLDVIDGRPGSFQKRGYLLQAFGTLDIDGFRQSEDSVATFRFGSVKDSYAARKGNDRNVGVIGVAFFQEQGSSFPWTEREIERRQTADPFPGRFAAPPE
jgi:hypothetical protein